jgi:hypothetical protein
MYVCMCVCRYKAGWVGVPWVGKRVHQADQLWLPALHATQTSTGTLSGSVCVCLPSSLPTSLLVPFIAHSCTLSLPSLKHTHTPAHTHTHAHTHTRTRTYQPLTGCVAVHSYSGERSPGLCAVHYGHLRLSMRWVLDTLQGLFMLLTLSSYRASLFIIWMKWNRMTYLLTYFFLLQFFPFFLLPFFILLTCYIYC